jgi:transcriptional regulator with XRE-family HTH domain
MERLRAMVEVSNADPALGAAVRRLRKAKGLTQEALAHRAELTLGTVARLELAGAAPTWATVRAVVGALDITFSELGAAIDAEEH